MDRLVLKADKRKLASKGYLRSLRQAGKVPGVLHRKGDDSIPVCVDSLELKKAIHTDAGLNVMLDLNIDGDTHLVRIEDLQYDVLRDGIYTHIDFGSVLLGDKFEVSIPVSIEGQDARENDGGLLSQPLHEIILLSTPDSIPSHVTIDISKMTIGDSVHAGDIEIPEGCELVTEPDETVASIIAPKLEAEPETEEDEEGGEGEEESIEPELVGKEEED